VDNAKKTRRQLDIPKNTSETPYVLPQPEQPFKGVIGKTYKDSTPHKLEIVKAAAGAPNVLYILIDDAGYGQWGTFGGQVPTPNLDRLAKAGLRYTRFHTTALCSPSRAALLTGRNHHSVGMGNITEIADGFPGYSSQIPKSAAMFPEILRQNGYSTAYLGKNHQIASWETSISGPYDRWPSLQGFDYFYGFLGGETNQWKPPLYRNTTPVEMEIPKGKEGHYTLNDSLVDDAIAYIHNQKSATPDRPFLIYYAPGATHAPHHVPKEWIDKFKGQFAQGWDKYREETFQRQLKIGVIPEDTSLTSRPEDIPAWDSLTPDQKRVAERLMETFAAFTAQTDDGIGRILDTLEEVGQSDNTLVFWEIGDNGASMEGTLYGAFNEFVSLNGEKEDPSYVIEHIDEIGGPKAYNHFPVGWAWAMNTPFQWGKQVASHFGGTRNPLVISWPSRIKDAGGLRPQFHHLIDIAPTILEAAQIQQPVEVNGVRQKPIEGVSMVYSFDSAAAPEEHLTQYFEIGGNRGVYQDGWIAAARHGRLPWEMGLGTFDFDKDVWELYKIDRDYSESKNLAEQYPQKLKELQIVFDEEAKKYNVYPLDDRIVERQQPGMRPSLIEGRTDFTYYPGTVRLPEAVAAPIKNRSFTMTAFIDVPQEGADGVLAAEGGVSAGYTFYVKNGKPVYEYNWFTQAYYKIVSSEVLTPGPNVVRVKFEYDGGGFGKGGMVSLFVNDKQVAKGRVDKTVPGVFSADETFDVGLDAASAVSADYEAPFRYTGTIKKVEIHLEPLGLASGEKEAVQKMKMDAAMSRQ